MGLRTAFFFTLIFASILGSKYSFAQQLNLPLNHTYLSRYETKLSNSDSITYHSGFKPLIENSAISYTEMQTLHKTKVEKHFAWLFKDKNWIKRKSKWENLYSTKGTDYYFDVNPVFNFEYGRDLANDNSLKFFKNTRGFMVNAHLTDKVSFSTSFYENQMYVPTYLRNYAAEISSQVYLTNNWKSENAVMPGQGRVKPFKTKGYDFAYAQAYVSYSPIKNINLQFGNGKFFVGEGYRSVLLSDNAYNYPYFRFTGSFFKNRIQYTSVFASLTNLRRLRYFTTPEAQFEKKAASFIYVSANISDKLQVGIFEGTIFRRIEDDQQLRKLDPLLFNPVIGVNTALNGFESEDANVLLGLNFKYQPLPKIYFYGQAALDNFAKEKMAWQFGAKWFDAFSTEDLSFQLELNQTSRYTYSAEKEIMSYSHYNQPLAQTTGGGTFEIMLRGAYRHDDFFYEYHFSYQTYRYYDGPNQYGKNVLLADNMAVDPAVYNSMSKVLYHDVKAGYIINPLYNMQAIVGWFHRGISHIPDPYKTSYLYIGFRTSLSNFYYDI